MNGCPALIKTGFRKLKMVVMLKKMTALAFDKFSCVDDAETISIFIR